MIIGQRLRKLRGEKNMSQGDIEKRTGLLRCHISRVENGHTVPGIETLDKMSGAVEVPLYRLFYEGEESPELPNLSNRETTEEIAADISKKEAPFLGKLRRLIAQMDEVDERLLLSLARKMPRR